MTEIRDVIGNGYSVPPNSRKWHHTASSWTWLRISWFCLPNMRLRVIVRLCSLTKPAMTREQTRHW